MIRTIVWLVLLVLHIICCVLVYLGIRTKLLKVKKNMLPVVVFVPLWGLLCVLVLHFQMFFHADDAKMAGVEKLKVNDEIYKSIFVEENASDKTIVPLEEALIINAPEQRRSLIMNVLYDNPADYIDLLHQARMNEDVEVVHYATTAMAELSKEYDLKLQRLEGEYRKRPEDLELLEEYTEFLGNYLAQGMAQGQMRRMQQTQYASLLRQLAKQKPEIEILGELAETQLVLEDYPGAAGTIEKMDALWHEKEQVWLLKLRYYAQQKQGEKLHDTIRQMRREEIYLSAKGKELIAFWENGGAQDIKVCS